MANFITKAAGVAARAVGFGNSTNRTEMINATPAEVAIMGRLADRKEREFIETRLGIPIHKFGDYSTYLETGHKKVWATFRSCKLISAILISATYKMSRGDDYDSEAVRSAGGFIAKPNPYDSWEEMIEMWTFHMELTGNAYWLKDEVDMLGRPKHIYPLLPQNIRIVPDEKTKVKKYLYKVNAKEIELDPSEVIHFRNPHPNNLHFGMGSIEPSEDIYSSYINANLLEEKFLENGAQLSGVLSREDATDIDDTEWKAFKKKFKAEYEGKKNAGKTAFLNGKWSYNKLGLTMQEMQTLEREKFTIEQIFLNHGVPLSVAGIQGAANYATSKQDEINFRRYKIVPMIDLLVGKLNADGFFKGMREDLKIVYELSGLVDVEQIVKDYTPLVENGAMTRNELREMCGLQLVENNPLLDQFMINANVVPIEMAGFADPQAMINAEEKSLARKKRRAIDLDDA